MIVMSMDISRIFTSSYTVDSPYSPLLIEALRKREAIIADHAWRDRDSNAHLQALIDVSHTITDLGTRWRQDPQHKLPARLNHFLEGCSYQKALAFLEGDAQRCE